MRAKKYATSEIVCSRKSVHRYLYPYSYMMSNIMTLTCFLCIVLAFSPYSLAWLSRGDFFSRRSFLRKATEVRCNHAASSDIKQLQILFNCDQIDPDEFSEFMFEMGCSSVSAEVISEKADMLNDEKRWADLIKTRCWSTALLRANFPNTFDSDSLVNILRETYPHLLFDVKLENVALQDWVLEVQKEWRPQVIGDLTIRFPWHLEENITTRHVLTLAGGAAFGTGDHPTTRLCCDWLAREVQLGQSVLDYGCGSAILALAALRFGASSAVGTDIDKDALHNARQNAQDNGLRVDLYLASDEDLDDSAPGETNFKDESMSILSNPLRGSSQTADVQVFETVEKIAGRQYDLVVANILAPILISLVSTISGHVKRGGKLALSGVVVQQAEKVAEAYRRYFREISVERTENDWVLITAKDKIE